MMVILMSETCWAHKKIYKIASDIKLVFYSSTIRVMFDNNVHKLNKKAVAEHGSYTNICTYLKT